MVRIFSAIVLTLLGISGAVYVGGAATGDRNFYFLETRKDQYSVIEVDGRKELEFVFEYYNDSSESVFLEDVQVGCECTNVVYSKDVITPGESGKLIVRYDARIGKGQPRKIVVKVKIKEIFRHTILEIDPKGYDPGHFHHVMFHPEKIKMFVRDGLVQDRFVLVKHLNPDCFYELSNAYITKSGLGVNVKRVNTSKAAEMMQRERTVAKHFGYDKDRVVLRIEVKRGTGAEILQKYTQAVIVIPGVESVCDLRIPLVYIDDR